MIGIMVSYKIMYSSVLLTLDMTGSEFVLELFETSSNTYTDLNESNKSEFGNIDI